MLLSCSSVDDLAGHAEAGDEDAGAALDDVVDALLDLAGHGREQVDAERLGGELADLGHLLGQLVGAHRRGAERADAAGLADGGDEAVVGHAAHAGEHDRVLDVEQVGESRAHAGTVAPPAAHVPVGASLAHGCHDRTETRLPATSAGVGAGAAEEPAVPARRRERDGPRLVLEHPAGEVAPAPVAGAGDDARSPRGRPARGRAPGRGATDMRWSATRWWRTARVVAAPAAAGSQRPGGDDRLGREAAGEQRLADALAGHHVGGRRGVADEQHAPVGERGPVDAGRDRPRRVAALELAAPARAPRDVRPVEQVGPQLASSSWIRRRAVAQHAEADVGPPVGQRERPGVAGQEVGLEPHVAAARRPARSTSRTYWRKACHSPR